MSTTGGELHPALRILITNFLSGKNCRLGAVTKQATIMLILYDTEVKSNLVRSLSSTSNPVQQLPRLVTSTLVLLVGVSGLAITNWPVWGGLKQGKCSRFGS